MTAKLHADELGQHRKYLYLCALRAVSNAELAEDLVQDTFVAALSAHAAFRGDSTVRTWLVGILKHKIMDAYRARGRAMDSLDAPLSADEDTAHAIDTVEAPQADPVHHLESKRLWELFGRVLGRMPARTAQSFVLSDLGGESTEEICRKLSVNKDHLAVLRHRARHALRAGMAQAVSA